MSQFQNRQGDFPFLQQCHSSGKPWTYLDSAATTLKPRTVIQSMTLALEHHSTNVHRSVCGLSDVTTELFESARARIARFIGAQAHEIVFVRNTTEAINILARCLPHRGATVVSLGEHHSNLLPWRGRQVRELPPLPDGRPPLAAIEQELAKGDVGLVAVSHIGNVTGHQTNIKQLAAVAHRHGALVMVDAAQSVGRVSLDVTDLDCDFLACSAHKMYGPTGIGLLFGKPQLLSTLQQHQAGGGTVESVADSCKWRDIPWRFEAGTPAIEAVLGWGSAVDYLQELDMVEVEKHERQLTKLALELVSGLPDCRIVGPIDAADRLGVVSFHFPGKSAHVVARTMSDRFGVCLRSGNHCAQPLHDQLKIPSTLRMSFGIYTTEEDIRLAVDALRTTLAGLPGQ